MRACRRPARTSPTRRCPRRSTTRRAGPRSFARRLARGSGAARSRTPATPLASRSRCSRWRSPRRRSRCAPSTWRRSAPSATPRRPTGAAEPRSRRGVAPRAAPRGALRACAVWQDQDRQADAGGRRVVPWLARHRHFRGGRGDRHIGGSDQVRARLRAEPRADAPDDHRPGGHQADGDGAHSCSLAPSSHSPLSPPFGLLRTFSSPLPLFPSSSLPLFLSSCPSFSLSLPPSSSSQTNAHARPGRGLPRRSGRLHGRWLQLRRALLPLHRPEAPQGGAQALPRRGR